MNRTLVEAVLVHAKTAPEKLAVGFKDGGLTYFALAERVKAYACLLKTNYHIQQGDCVMITAYSKPEYVVAFLGIQYLGAVTVPLDKIWFEDTILDLYKTINPALLITDAKITNASVNKAGLNETFALSLETEVPAEMEYTVPDDNTLAEMLFTTGTTGKSKGVMLCCKNISAITNNNRAGVGFQESDVLLVPLPLCHSLGLRGLRMALYFGATLVLQNGFTFTKELRRNIDRFHCTGFLSVPASMETLVRKLGSDFVFVFGNMRYMEIGAGSLSYDLKKRLPALLPKTKIYNTWGSSETGGVIFLPVSERQDKMKALGRPVASAEIKIIDENGAPITARDIAGAGRLAVKGDMTMAGYYQLPALTAETIVDGWLLTNDLVYSDEEGFVYMLGRSDDIINVGGEKVSPIEIENTASEFPFVADTACIGVDDPDGVQGQVPVLYVCTTDGFNEKELVKFLSAKLEPFKLPKMILPLDEIPRNRMKKLDRKAVKKLWESRNHTAPDGNNETALQMLLSRRSVRHFREKAVSASMLETLLQAGASAPSANNFQTWHFTAVNNSNVIDTLKSLGAKTAQQCKTKFYGFENPKALIIISNDMRNENGGADSACAAENILLAAHFQGLGACWLNGFSRICNEAEMREYFTKLGVPERHKVYAVIALGYPEEIPKAPPKKTNVFTIVR